MFKRLVYPSVIGFLLLSLAIGGSRANPGFGAVLRETLANLPGLGWLISATTPIADLGQYRGGTAYFGGQVTRHLPLLNGALYQVTDSSGAIWVQTSGDPPPLNQAISLQGTLRYETILVQGQDIGELYAEELERVQGK